MDNNSTYNKERNKLKLVLNSFTDAILFESKERIIEFVNDSFCNLFKIKFSPEAIKGTNAEEGVIASSFQFKNPSRFIYRIEEILEERIPIKSEEVVLRDGRVLLRDYSPISFENELLGHLWIYKESRQINNGSGKAEYSINESLFESIVDYIPVDIFVLNALKQYIFVNKHCLADERKRKFIIGKTDSEYRRFYSVRNGRSFIEEEALDKTITEAVLSHFEIKSNDLSGMECYKRTSLYPVVTEEGVVEKVLGFSIDISNEKEADSRLNEIIEQYTHALNCINDVVLIANGDLQLNFLNNAYHNQIFDTTLDEGTIYKHIPFQKYDFYKHLFSVLSGDVDNAGGRISLKGENDVANWYRYNIHKGILTNENKQGGIVAVLNDITTEVGLEENLLEVVKREKELNELKSAFVNMVSHEMRTPLAIISSSAEIIQMMLASGKPKEEIENYANNILSEVERMTTFMNDILMISKIEAGKIEFKPEAASLISFVNEIIQKSYLPWKDNRNLNLFVKGNERIFPFDVKMLRHILQNLIENAFKYSPNKPSPKLRLRYSNSYITFSVIDSGIGIHPDDIQKLFSSFSRGRNVGSISGSGIGLVVVNYFVGQHNGSISIKSKLNVGTIFSVKIPF